MKTLLFIALISCLLCVKWASSQAAETQRVVSMPDQIADDEDPCARRHHVEDGQSCAIVAMLNRITVEDLLLLNPGMKCNPFFSGVNLCIDKGKDIVY